MTPRFPLACLFLAFAAHAAEAQTQTPTPAPSAAGAAGVDPAAAFLAATAKQPGVVTLGSGLEYKIIQSGPSGGASPHIGDEVQVAYEGKLVDGTVFDTTTPDNPASLTVGELVPAWNEALVRMRPGDEWMLYVSPQLGYGDAAAGPIPAHSVLIFRLKLLSVGPLN